MEAMMKHSMLSLSFLLVVSAGLVTCASTTRSTSPADLGLSVTLDTTGGQAIARIRFENRGTRPVAISRSHGYGSTWLRFNILDAQGRTVRYPPNLPEFVLTTLPRYDCIPARGNLQWDIDLQHWHLEFGAASRKPLYAFELQRGERYRLQAVYADTPRQHIDCAAIDGVVESDWVEFSF
jgi:hypothetical protein